MPDERKGHYNASWHRETESFSIFAKNWISISALNKLKKFIKKYAISNTNSSLRTEND